MTNTPNYNLNVIARTDAILTDVDALGQNATSIDTILAGKQDNITIATSISSSSTNTEVAGAKAVYDNSLHIYIAEPSERRIGTWKNGKPLYEQVLTGTTANVTTEGTPVSTNGALGSGTANEIDMCYIDNAYVLYSNGKSVWTCPYYNNDLRFVKAQLYKTETNIWRYQVVSNGTVYNNCTFTLIVRYTKTADSGN